jgi:fumarate reductase subunit D
MKTFTLLSHQWKSATRSAAASKSIGIKIFMGFLFFFLFLELLGGGFYIGNMLTESSKTPINDLLGYGFYFFLAILMSRYMLQKLPTFMVRPYLNLPIKKRKLVNFILTKPLFNSLNILPLSFILAICLGLHQHINAYTFWMIFASVIIIDLFANYLSIYIKRIQIKHEFVFYLFLAIVASLLLLDQFKIIDFQAISTNILAQVLNTPLYLLAGILLFSIAYYLNYQLLYKHFSLEDFGKGDAKHRNSLEHVSYLDRFGKIGTFILLELKMCVRNKRTRTMIFIAPLFLLYGLFFYTNPIYLKLNGFLIFVGLFISGGFMMSFGLYFFAWESGHFDLMLTANNTYKDYIKAKYYLMLSTSTIIFLLSTFYIYFGIEILIINIACYFFNIGVNSLLLLYFATNNNKHMDLSKGSAFNYQGVGARHFVLMIPLLVIPIFIYLPFGLMDQANLGFAMIGIIGLIGLIFREKMLDLITQRFMNKRHQMSEGFRNK